jgi:hypothetical protein
MVFENLSALAKLRKRKCQERLPPVPPMSTIIQSCSTLFVRNSIYAFNIRFAMSLFFQTASVLTSKKKFTLRNLFDINVHDEALRWGLFVGAFSTQFELLKAALAHYRGGKQDWINSFLAATSAGPWYLVLPENRREWLTLYAPARAISATWSYFVTRKYATPIDDGAILFILASSQIMYAYVMRPETLKESYWKFIINAGPLERDILGLVKSHQRGVHNIGSSKSHGTTMELGQQLNSYFKSLPKSSHKHGSGVPCHILHPGRTCQQQTVFTFKKGFSQAVVLYSSLGLTATLAFNVRRAITQPLSTIWYLATSSIRSAIFLALFPSLYMTSVCLYKNQTKLRLHQSFYFIAGIFGGLSIFIERSARRFELAMFALPRALQSIGNITVKSGWLPPWYNFFTLISFSLSMGVLLTAYDIDRSLLVPAMKSLLGNFFLTHNGKSKKKDKRIIDRTKWKNKNLISGQYRVDSMNITLAPRIEEVIEYGSDEERKE